MSVTLKLHVLDFLQELLLFLVESIVLLSEMLDLLEVESLLLVEFTLRCNLCPLRFLLLLHCFIHLVCEHQYLLMRLLAVHVDLLFSFQFDQFTLLDCLS